MSEIRLEITDLISDVDTWLLVKELRDRDYEIEVSDDIENDIKRKLYSYIYVDEYDLDLDEPETTDVSDFSDSELAEELNDRGYRILLDLGKNEVLFNGNEYGDEFKRKLCDVLNVPYTISSDNLISLIHEKI